MKHIFLTLLAISLHFGLIAQVQNVMITDQYNPEEPSIFINPKNPAQIMAGVNIKYIYLSNDSGKTWTGTEMTSDFGVWGDPCLLTDTAGNFCFLHLSNPPQGNWIDRIVFQKYETSINQWTTDTFMGLNGTKAQDKEWCIVDQNTNILYTTWTEFDEYGSVDPLDSSRIMFSRSLDGGQSWSPAKQINEVSGDCIDSDNTTEGAVPAVGPNGEVYVAWAGPAGLRFDRSLDSGTTWLDKDIFIDPMPTGWDYSIPGISRANGLPITLCDLSGGPHHGHIYVNWSDQRNGAANTDIFMSKSTDGGQSWSSPLRINDDTTQRHQFFTWMTIDQVTGYLYCVFYDRRNHSDRKTDVYLAISKDGGQSFSNHMISDSAFWPVSTVFFGDYTNISAHNGMIRPIWTRLDNHALSVWTALIDVDSIDNFIGNPPKPYSEISLQAYPNPARDKISFSFKTKKSETLSIEITDIQGRHLAYLVQNKKYPEGMHIEVFQAKDYHLPAGVYFFTLKDQNRILRTKKFILQ
jgi:hypothetical protein